VYTTALCDELSAWAETEFRAELEAALAAFTKELQRAQRKRAAASQLLRGHSLSMGSSRFLSVNEPLAVAASKI
jgi:hypothetical protein